MRILMTALSVAALVMLGALGMVLSRAMSEVSALGGTIASIGANASADRVSNDPEPVSEQAFLVPVGSMNTGDEFVEDDPRSSVPLDGLEFLQYAVGEVSADDIGELLEPDAEFEQAFGRFLAAPDDPGQVAAWPVEIEDL